MYQVPKIRVDVEIHIQNSDIKTGAIFITENMLNYKKHPRLEDFLNQDERFFPFSEDSGRFLLFNKERLVLLRSSEDDSHDLSGELMLESIRVEVHLSNGLCEEGEIYPNLPKDRLRVSDFYNQEEPFLAMYQEKQKLIINTRHILYVRDLQPRKRQEPEPEAPDASELETENLADAPIFDAVAWEMATEMESEAEAAKGSEKEEA